MSLTGNVTADKLLRGKINGLEKIRGYSAYEIALINGFKGTEEEWLDSLNGGLVTVDKQLYRSGHAADAKVTGERFSAMDDEISVERSRINVIANLPEGSTTGDAELADIRIAHNGREYVNAGEAVRVQVKEAMTGYVLLTSTDFEQGTFAAADGQTNANHRIRMKQALRVEAGTVVDFNAINSIGLYHIGFLLADENLKNPTVIYQDDTWNNKPRFDVTEAGYFYMVVANGYTYGTATAITTADLTEEIQLTPPNSVAYLRNDVAKLNEQMEIDLQISNYTAFTNTAFEQGTFAADGLAHLDIRIRWKEPFPVKKGAELSVIGSDGLYWNYFLLGDNNLDTPTIIEETGWTDSTKFKAKADGYFYVIAANAKTYGTSTPIAITDFTGVIKVTLSASKYDDFNADKVRQFTSLILGTEKVEPFLYFTDPHLAQDNGWEEEFAGYMKVLKRYFDSAPVDNIICGGDWFDKDIIDDALYKLGYVFAQTRAITENFHLVLGNHDTNYLGKMDADSADETGSLGHETINNLWYRSHGNSYYSYDANETRFFILDSDIDSYELTDYYNTQLGWFANALKDNTADNIALFFHIVTHHTGGAFLPFAQTVFQISEAFNNRSTISVNGVSYNFANATGKVRFAMVGHRHFDRIDTYSNIPCVSTTQLRDGGVPTFDLCLADYNNNVLNMIRIGTGENRSVEI